MKKTVIYTLVGLLAPALSILFLPIYLGYLTPNEYVAIALSNSFLAVLTVFLNVKVDQAFRTIYFYDTYSPKKQLQLFRTLFSFQVVSFAIWASFFYFIGETIFKTIYKTDFQFMPHTFIILISYLISLLSNFYFIYLQNKLEIKNYSFYAISNVLLTHFLQITCVAVIKLSFEWFLLASLFSNSVIFLCIYLSNISLFKFEISRKILKEALSFSLPFIPFLILFNIENQLDRFFIEKFLSIEELARYLVLLSISSIITTLFNSIDSSIRPQLFSVLSKKDTHRIPEIQEQMDFYLFVGILALSFLLFAGTNIKWFLNNEKYNGISIYFSWLILAFLPLLFSRFLALIVVYENKVVKNNYFSFAKILLTTCLFCLLIPIYKITGALIVVGISNILNTLINYKIIETRVKPTLFVLSCAMLLTVFSILLINLTHLKLVSFLSTFQFIVFVLLFTSKYWNEIKNQFQLLKTNLS